MTTHGAPTRPVVLIGAGGHARVLLSTMRALGLEMHGVCAPEFEQPGPAHWHGVPVLGGDAALGRLDPTQVDLLLGIGPRPGSNTRQHVFLAWRQAGFRFATLVHPCAWISDDVQLGEGVQVMAGAVIQPGSILGANSVLNTRSSADHDCHVGSHVHIAPGSTLCGSVHIGDGSFLGAGCTIIPGVCIGAGTTIGAGTLVTRDLPAGETLRNPRSRAPLRLSRDGRTP